MFECPLAVTLIRYTPDGNFVLTAGRKVFIYIRSSSLIKFFREVFCFKCRVREVKTENLESGFV